MNLRCPPGYGDDFKVIDAQITFAVAVVDGYSTKRFERVRFDRDDAMKETAGWITVWYGRVANSCPRYTTVTSDAVCRRKERPRRSVSDHGVHFFF